MAILTTQAERIYYGTTAELMASTREAKKNQFFYNTDTGELVKGPGLYSACVRFAGAEVPDTIVRVATTANITRATALNNGDTLDGVTLATGDLVLVKDQSAPEENGIYVVGTSPARSTAYDTWAEHVGKLIKVTSGTANAGKFFRNGNTTGGTLNTTGLTFPEANNTALRLGKRSQFAALATAAPATGDVFVFEDASDNGVLKRCTLAEMITAINI